MSPHVRLLISLCAVLALTCGGCQPGSLFTVKAAYGDYLVDGLALEGCIEQPLPLPFLPHFKACLPAQISSSGVPRHYGPLPLGGQVIGGRRAKHALGDVDELDTFVHGLQIRAPILLHAFTGGSHPAVFGMMRSWFSHLVRVGLDGHALFASDSDADCALVVVWAPCAVHKWRRRGGGDGRHSDSVDFRWNVTLALLRMGHNVIQMDSDAFVLSKRAVVLLEQSPLLVQGLSDRLLPADVPVYKGQTEQGYCRNNGTCQSTGFTYFRAHKVVIDEVAAFLSHLDSGKEWEQAAWQPHAAILREQGVYNILSQTGHDAFANWYAAAYAMERHQDASFLLLHMGYEHGADKEHIFRCAQLWLGDEGS